MQNTELTSKESGTRVIMDNAACLIPRLRHGIRNSVGCSWDSNIHLHTCADLHDIRNSVGWDWSNIHELSIGCLC